MFFAARITLIIFYWLIQLCWSKAVFFLGPDPCRGKIDHRICSRYTNKDYYCQHSWMQLNCCHYCSSKTFENDDCETFKCPDEGDAVCASNGITYMNRCKLRKAIFCEKLNIQEVFEGYCQDYYQRSCSSCFSYPQPVCATDGETYMNDCYLQNAISCYGLRIKFLYRGICRQRPIKCPIDCPPDDYSTVCATDGISYTRCALENAIKCHHKQIQSYYGGWCDEKHIAFRYKR